MTDSSPRSSRALVVRGDGYGLLEVAGPDRARWLHGIVSNEVKGLRPGEGNYATLLTGKGKMVAELWVLCLEDRFLIVSRPEHREHVAQALDRYLLMDDVSLSDAGGRLALIGVHGEDVGELVERATGLDLPDREGHHVAGKKSGEEVRVVAVNEFSWPGYLMLVPPDIAEQRRSELCPGAMPGVDVEVLRIENGVPRWGAELDEDTIPVEAGLEARGISYEKGCYVGQEIVARIKSHGSVARRLWGVRWSGDGAVPPRSPLLRDGKEAGAVTSSAFSPRFGSISLGYLRRGLGEAGAEVTTAGGQSGRVVSLPFAP